MDGAGAPDGDHTRFRRPEMARAPCRRLPDLPSRRMAGPVEVLIDADTPVQVTPRKSLAELSLIGQPCLGINDRTENPYFAKKLFCENLEHPTHAEKPVHAGHDRARPELYPRPNAADLASCRPQIIGSRYPDLGSQVK